MNTSHIPPLPPTRNIIIPIVVGANMDGGMHLRTNLVRTRVLMSQRGVVRGRKVHTLSARAGATLTTSSPQIGHWKGCRAPGAYNLYFHFRRSLTLLPNTSQAPGGICSGLVIVWPGEVAVAGGRDGRSKWWPHGARNTGSTISCKEWRRTGQRHL